MRLAATVLSLLLLSTVLVRAGDPAPFFADGFESGTTGAWSAPLWYDDFDGDDDGDELDAGEPPVCTAMGSSTRATAESRSERRKFQPVRGRAAAVR